MTTPYPKRLIEVDLPIRRISAHARREKSIRHGHISTLHIWWARRPLAACRAVICAALWPDPADELCPQPFRDAMARLLPAFAEQVRRSDKLGNLCSTESRQRWMRTTEGSWRADHPASWFDMRAALLDFIADFANWDASTVPAYLATARGLTQAAHEALGGEPGTRPLVVDPFAGGGAIPLEALRVGADAFASDLNPVAVLLNKVVLEYIPKYGNAELRMMNAEGEEVVFNGLAEAVRYWGQWVKEQAERELAEFYPKDPDGATPIAYLWARTIRCEGPGCGAEVPLMRSQWLAQKGEKSVALRLVPDKQAKRVDFEIVQNAKAKDVGEGTVRQGSVICPVCGFTTQVDAVRRQLAARLGGAADARLYCVVTLSATAQGRFYRLPTQEDLTTVQRAGEALQLRIEKHEGSQSLIPDEKFTGAEPRRIPLPQYGITGFRDMFTARQALALSEFALSIKRLGVQELGNQDSAYSAVLTILALCLDKVIDLSNSLCAWEPIAQCPRHLFARQAMPIVWDFAEGVPIGESSGSFSVILGRSVQLLNEVGSDWAIGHAQRASALAHPLPDDAADAVITDPPYYYSVPYSDLSDFFYVWLKRSIGDLMPELFFRQLTPKDEECVQNLPHAGAAHLQKGRDFYEQAMRRSLEDARRVAKPNTASVVVFAHTDTAAWEALLGALIESGWFVTASWPVDTEMATRIVAQRQSTLGSSIHLVCRPRENADGALQTNFIGDWREVLQELPTRIHAWLPRLAREGIVGADAIFACLGPALEIFSRYGRVEKASGEVMTLSTYLEYVWAAVSKEALDMVFQGADTSGFEEDARLTAMWLWTLGGERDAQKSNFSEKLDFSPAAKVVPSTGYTLEYDAARKIAQGLGAHLEQLGHLVEVKGSNARLLPAVERVRYLFGVEGVKQPARRGKREPQMSLFEAMGKEEAEAAGWSLDDQVAVPAGRTVLDRVHQSMLLFAAGRSNALKRYLVDEGIGKDERFWSLAQALSALYPSHTDEKRWVDGVLARKKGLGF